VAKFGYVRKVSAEKTPLLALMDRPLSDLGDELCVQYAGRPLSRKALRADYDKYRARNLFVEKNWRDVLSQLEIEGRVTCVPPRGERKVMKGEVTFGPNTVVTFPKEKK
jgi:hypothetical protein